MVAALVAYGAQEHTTPDGAALDFTPDAEANELIRSDPFAFLCAVIFDQGVPAERAWLAPRLLRDRLGHLDPVRVAVEEDRVRNAIQNVPKLHRYIDKMPG